MACRGLTWINRCGSPQPVRRSLEAMVKAAPVQTAKKVRVYKTPLKKCVCCGNPLRVKVASGSSTVKCTIFGSETIAAATTQSKICWPCGVHVRCNFVWLGGQKINCLSYNDMVKMGLYFASSKTAFTIPYLELCYFRLLRAKTAPGQEAAVRQIVQGEAEGMFWQAHSFRDHLLHALEGFAVARRTPDTVVQFNLDYPAKAVVKVKNPVLLFPPSKRVTEVAFDGHFGVHRALIPDAEAARSVRKKGRPMKVIHEHKRSCHCKVKDAERHVLPDRTAGWQFALDPKSGQVLGAYEHLVNERNADKVALLQRILCMDNVNATCLIHDNACHFESYVMSRGLSEFDGIRDFLVDTFHMKNHKCAKSTRTRREKARVKGVNTSVCEILNAWLRPLNFFLNHVRPHSHKFWVEEACAFYNCKRHTLSGLLCRRTNSAARARKSK